MPVDADAAERRERARFWLDVIVSVVILIAILLLAYYIVPRLQQVEVVRQSAVPSAQANAVAIPDRPVSLEGAVTRGDPAAPVVLLEFVDFSCPFCRRFATETLPTLVADYVDRGQVALATRHFPLASLESPAGRAAEVAVCAERQGRFWAVHDAFFAGGLAASSDEQQLLASAAEAGVDTSLLVACLGDAATSSQVRQDIALARVLQLQTAPVFMVGIREGDRLRVMEVIMGAQPLEEFQRVIGATLAVAQAQGS